MPSGPKTTAAPAVRRVMRQAPTPASAYEEEPGDDDDPTPIRRRRSDPEEPEPLKPAARRSRSDDGVEDNSHLIGSGWKGANKVKSELPSDFAKQFTVPDDPVLIKFLQDAPFASYKQHWADWLGKGVKKSYVCIVDDCPICNIGDKASGKFCYNIIDFTDTEHPVNSVLSVGIKVSNLIEKYSKNERTAPINRDDLYFEISKDSSSAGPVQTILNSVKARDVEEDWDMDVLVPDEIESFLKKAATSKEFVQISSGKVLQDVADAYKD